MRDRRVLADRENFGAPGRPRRAGDDVHCERSAFPGFDADGGMAELLRTSARSVAKLDPGTRPADVAALADAGLTAYHAVKKAVPLVHPGSTCVVVGAGGPGHIGVQCLRALTATSILLLHVDEAALELAREWAPVRPSASTVPTSGRCST